MFKQKCFSKNSLVQYSLIVTAGSIISWRKIGDTLFLLWKTIIFCFWTKANYSRFSCYSNEIWNHAKFLCLLLTACKISDESNERLARYCTFIFSMSCRIASVTSYLSENVAKTQQSGGVHLAHIWNGISREPFGALRSVMTLFLRFLRSLIWADVFSTGVSLSVFNDLVTLTLNIFLFLQSGEKRFQTFGMMKYLKNHMS